MAELEKEIIGSWFEIKSSMENPLNLREYFNPGADEIAETIERLRQSIEGGIIEYKKTLVDSAYRLIESLNYDSSALPQLGQTAKTINIMTYVILLQRLMAKKTIKIRTSGRDGEETEEEVDSKKQYSISDISGIIREVQELVKNEPNLKSNKNVINIFLQISKYRSETDSMKKIFPNIPQDKKENFRVNYARTINDIFAKLLASYQQLSSEINPADAKETGSNHPLEMHDLSGTVETLRRQAEISDRIRTTFAFADRERFRILDTLRTLKQSENLFRELLEKEEKHYYNISLSDSGKREISRHYCLEIIKILERQAETAG